MPEELIPEDVRAFLLQHIDSIAQLEALLLLRNDPTYAWSVEALAKRLYITTQETAAILQQLVADRFLTTTQETMELYQYHPESSALATMVDRIAELYRQYLIPVTNIIHAKPRSRVQEFADAFKLRKGD